MRMPLFDTKLSEAHDSGKKRFIIEGQPVMKSLHWVVYGPGLALIVIAVIGAFAWANDFRSQPAGAKIMLTALFFIVPLLAWIIGGVILGKVSQAKLNALAAAETERVEVIVDTVAHTVQINTGAPVALADIQGFKLISDSGTYYTPNEQTASIYHFIMETSQGHVNILPKYLGNIKQKLQLRSQLERFLEKET